MNAQRTTRAASVVLLSIICLTVACSRSSLTQIKVSVDQDTSAPLELDQVEVVVFSEAGDKLQTATADLSKKPLPRSVTLVQDDRRLERVRLVATGLRDQHVVVEHKAEATFERGKLVELHIVLSALCEDFWVTCNPDQTCVAGQCRDIKTASAIGSAPPPSIVAPSDALAPPVATDSTIRPLCEISHPIDGQDLFLHDDLKLEGRCYDTQGQPLDDDLSWYSDIDGPIGTHASQVIKTDDLHVGVHQLGLCVSVDNTSYCSRPVSITFANKPPPPSATIMSVRQDGQPDGGPFSAGKPIAFEGEGKTAAGDVHLTWTDSIVGEFGSGSTAMMDPPLVGRHQVTLIATDKASQTPMPPTTVTFDVLAADRLSAGQTQLVEPFVQINSDWADAGPTAVTALAGDDSGVVFVGTEAQAFAFQGDPSSVAASPAVGGNAGQDPMTISGVHALLVDPRENDGRVFFGTDSGVIACAYARGRIPLDASSCGSFHDNAIGDLSTSAVSTLAYLDLGTERFLAVGTSGGLWIARDAKGQARNAVRVSGDSDAVVGVAASGDAFWFATQSAGVYKYDPKAAGVPELYSTDGPIPPFSSLCADPDGGLWLGTRDHGVSRFDSAGSGLWRAPWVHGDGSFDGLASNHVTALAAGAFRNGDAAQTILWVGTDQGLTRLDFHTSSFTPIDLAAGLPSEAIEALWVLQPSGALLIGTSLGLALYNGS